MLQRDELQAVGVEVDIVTLNLNMVNRLHCFLNEGCSSWLTE